MTSLQRHSQIVLWKVWSLCVGGQLTVDELNSLIAHAHRRIEQLERQVDEQQSSEQRRVSEALRQQGQEHETLVEERLTQEKQRMNAELDMLRQQWVLTTDVIGCLSVNICICSLCVFLASA